MEYKGYNAKIEYDDDGRVFNGYVIGIKDVIHFQAETVNGLEKEFKASVTDYLAFCKERGKKPDKPYSGKLVFRTSPEVHRKLAIAAELTGKSLNQFIEEAALQASQHPSSF